jgi:hypothetical protein
MDVVSKKGLVDTLKFMLELAEDSPEESYFIVETHFAEIDKTFQERSHKMQTDRVIEQQESGDKK